MKHMSLALERKAEQQLENLDPIVNKELIRKIKQDSKVYMNRTSELYVLEKELQAIQENKLQMLVEFKKTALRLQATQEASSILTDINGGEMISMTALQKECALEILEKMIIFVNMMPEELST